MEEPDSTTPNSPTSYSRNGKQSETEQAGSELAETESETADAESEDAGTESEIAEAKVMGVNLDAVNARTEAANAEAKLTEAEDKEEEADTDEEDALLESDETESESTETDSVETKSAPRIFKSKARVPKIIELEEGKEVEIVVKVDAIAEKKEETDEKEVREVEKEIQKEEKNVERETQKEQLKKTEAQAPPFEPELEENSQTQVSEEQALSAEKDTNSDRPEVEIIENNNHRRYSVESNGENNIKVVGETEKKEVSDEPEIVKVMAGPQHPFPTGFPNTQPNAIRNQFGGGQMVSGLMGPQQGMVSPQQFNSGVAGGVSPNLGMLNAQQVMNQQQVIPPQLQHQQQMHMQQQQQQAALAQNNQAGAPTASQIPVPQNQPPPQRQVNRDLNTASLCKLGQETVQEIVSRMTELFQLMKVMQPPNGTPQGQSHATEKKTKIQDQLKTISILFKRLRVIYEKCNENCQLQGMEYTHIESLIPIKEEWDMKSDEKKASEAYRLASEEQKEVMEQLVQRNRQLKEIIEHLRRIISEINTMMGMRRS